MSDSIETIPERERKVIRFLVKRLREDGTLYKTSDKVFCEQALDGEILSPHEISAVFAMLVKHGALKDEGLSTSDCRMFSILPEAIQLEREIDMLAEKEKRDNARMEEDRRIRNEDKWSDRKWHLSITFAAAVFSAAFGLANLFVGHWLGKSAAPIEKNEQRPMPMQVIPLKDGGFEVRPGK